MSNVVKPSQQASSPAGIYRVLSGPIFALVVVSLVSNLLMLTGPLFMLQVYDRVLASQSQPTLVVLTVLVCGLYGFYAFLDGLRARMGARFANVVDSQIAERLFAASVKVKLIPSAAANINPIRDGDVLRQFLGGGGPMVLLDLPWIPIYLGIVFMFHPMLGWLAVSGAIIITLLMVANEFSSRKPSQQTNVEQAARQRQTDDACNNAESVMAMGMLNDLQNRWAEQTQKLKAVQRTAGDRAAYFSSATKGLRFLLQSSVLALGAYLVIQGEMTGGLMIAASVITSRALAPVEQAVAQWRAFIGARQAVGRIKKVLSVGKTDERETRLPLPNAKVMVQGLATAPTGSRASILSGVGFELNAGEGMGVLGPSGAGKSSLARAMVGVWPCMAGELRLDGALLSHYDANQVGQIVGYLPQRVELFSGTVAQNIARFTPEASSEDVIEAARAANIHELVSALPDGYDTQVGAQGDLLSAGQKQRVGLARALFGQPFLIVLDEPNSNLDAEGDAALTDAIQMVRARGAIVIVVAHRPSAIAAVDKLLYVQNGKQVTFGEKNEVLQQITQGAGDNVRTMKASSS